MEAPASDRIPVFDFSGPEWIEDKDCRAISIKCSICGVDLPDLSTERQDTGALIRFGYHLYLENSTCSYAGKNVYQVLESAKVKIA